jgi:hypothetical protein
VIEEHDATQAGAAGDYLGVHGDAGGQAPQTARFVTGHLGGKAGQMGELDDAGAAALLVADETRTQRAHHAEVARLAQRLLIVRLHVPYARDAHEASGVGAAAQARVIRQHLADVDDDVGGTGGQRRDVIVVALVEDGLREQKNAGERSRRSRVEFMTVEKVGLTATKVKGSGG